MSKITSHGRREGAADYRGRAAEVAAGREKPTWAWPLAGADEAYLYAVGVEAVCRQIGIAPDKWESVCHEWLSAFRAGYEAAHAADEYPHDQDPAGSGPTGHVTWGAPRAARGGYRYRVGVDTLGWWWWQPWSPREDGRGRRGRWMGAVGPYEDEDEAFDEALEILAR